MKHLRNLSVLQLIGLTLIPITAYALAWSMNGFSAPSYFRTAASAVGVRVTQVCRPNNASYGATRSLHKRCLAMDIGVETPRSKVAALAQYGLSCEFHRKGYYGATADHYHCSASSTAESRVAARKDQSSRASDIRKRNKGSSGASRSSARKSQRKKASSIRRSNKEQFSSGFLFNYDQDSGAQR